LFVGYSYEAAEDNELSFYENDRIIEIEAVSDDWWSGRDQHGNVGLFPGGCFRRAYLRDLGIDKANERFCSDLC
jgi:hypothetical protein